MELVKVSTNAQGVQVVSARELYAYLGYNTAVWRRWYLINIDKNKFAIQGVDYEGFNLVLNGNPSKDYALTLDFAKRLSQMARTERGEQIRNYFIACEEKLKSLSLPSLEQMTLLVIQGLNLKLEQATVEKDRERQQKELAQGCLELANKTILDQVPTVEYAESVLSSVGLINTTTIAKELGLSAVRLNRTLHERKIIYHQQDSWVLYAKYQGLNYTGTETYPARQRDGSVKTVIHTKWTEEGRQFIHRLLNKALTA